ncbi:MAG: sulfotransferase [Gammaproteobacteria bacterium]|jgi:tetratricopeptide (TPR) repeat protein
MQQSLNSQVSQLHRRAQQALNRRAYRDAHECCARILALEPGHADAHFLMGMIAFAHNHFGKALALIDRAVAREPLNAEYLARRGQCLAMMKRHGEALESAERALAAGAADAPTLDTIGVVLSHVGEHARAREVLGRAAAAAPENPQYQFNLASAALFVGDFSAAEAAYEAAIAARPDFCRAHWALADLVTATPEKNHIGRLERLLAELDRNDRSSGVNDRLYLSHALSKELEDLGQYARSLEVLERGKRARRDAMDWTIDEDRALFETLEAVFDAEAVASPRKACDSAEPIFVLGMPRTGTTLVDRILASHSEVCSAGELQNFGVTLKRMSGTPTNRVLDPATIRAAVDVDFGELGQRYIESTRPITGATPRFVDKLPMNFFYVGFIALSLPAARIICLRRNAMDSCLSNYRQLFRLDHPYYSYAYSLDDVADYFVMFERLMAHWDRILPGRILHVHYEDLVQEPRAQTARVLEHCGLPWQDACLSFHKNTAPVATASAVQVREPIHARSLGRWKRYGSALEGLRTRLESAGIATR